MRVASDELRAYVATKANEFYPITDRQLMVSEQENNVSTVEPASSNRATVSTGSSIDSADVSEALDALNKVLELQGQRLTLGVDETTGRMSVAVVDASTGAVLFQHPSPAQINIQKALSKRKGIILDTSF